jgi:hypothetical protein
LTWSKGETLRHPANGAQGFGLDQRDAERIPEAGDELNLPSAPDIGTRPGEIQASEQVDSLSALQRILA